MIVPPVTGENTLILDHIWTNLDCECKSYVIVPNMSDNYTIALVYTTQAYDKSTIVSFNSSSSACIENIFEKFRR